MIASVALATERKTATDALADQAALLDKARDAIMAISMTGAVIYWNKSAERLFGWTSEETIGQPASTILPGKELGFVLKS